MSKYIYKKYTLGTRYTSWSAEKKEELYIYDTLYKSDIVGYYFTPEWTGSGYQIDGERTLGEIVKDGSWYIYVKNTSTKAEWVLFKVEKINSNTVDIKLIKRTYRTRSSYNVKGRYIKDIVAENGTYPNDGKHTDGYWYVRGGLAFPEFKMRIGGVLKTSENGWVKINGQLREIDTIWTKINGALREVE